MFSITTILSGALGLVGLSGLGLYGLTFLGIGSGLVAWFAAKNIPWKLIVICALALLIALLVFGAFETFRENQKHLEQARIELSQEKTAHAAEKARADNYVVQHDADVARVEQLEKDRSQIEERASALQTQIDSVDLQQDFDHDSAKTIAGLNSRNAELTRLLNNATGGSVATRKHAAARRDRPRAPLSLKAIF